MNVYENQVNCIDVEDVTATLKQYQEMGCGATGRDGEGCVTLDCNNEELRVCERRESGAAATTA